MKMMIAAVLFAISAGSALADNFGGEVSTSNVMEAQGSATAQVEPGVAVQVGKFFGNLLKAPLTVGRDVARGFKAGVSSDSQETQDAKSASVSETTHQVAEGSSSSAGPQGLRDALNDRLAQARQSFATSCYSCSSGGAALAKGHSAGSGFPRYASVSSASNKSHTTSDRSTQHAGTEESTVQRFADDAELRAHLQKLQSRL